MCCLHFSGGHLKSNKKQVKLNLVVHFIKTIVNSKILNVKTLNELCYTLFLFFCIKSDVHFAYSTSQSRLGNDSM